MIPAARAKPESCAICDEPQPPRELYVREHGGVCTECAARALASFAKAGRPETLGRAALRSLLALDDRTPFARSRPVIEAALVLADGDADYVRQIAGGAGRLGRHDLAADALQTLAPLGKVQDTAYGAYHCYHHGLVERGLARIRAIDADAIAGPARLFVLIHRAALTLVAPTAAAIDRAAADVDAAHALAPSVRADLSPEEARRLDASMCVARGGVALARGDAAAARTEFEGAIEAGDRRAPVWIFLGDAEVALGRRGHARDAWVQAEKAAHPESFHAAEARRRLAQPYR